MQVSKSAGSQAPLILSDTGDVASPMLRLPANSVIEKRTDLSTSVPNQELDNQVQILYCVAPRCNSTSKTHPTRKFFQFPTSEEELNNWLTTLKCTYVRELCKDNPNLCICDRHILFSAAKASGSDRPNNRQDVAPSNVTGLVAIDRILRCIASGCNVTNRTNPELRLSCLPARKEHLKAWLERLGAMHVINYPCSRMSCLRVCEKHFLPSAWRYPGSKKLNWTALPEPVTQESTASVENTIEAPSTSETNINH